MFDGGTNIEAEVNKFCGSIAEPVTSKKNVAYVRFFGEKGGINTQFNAVYTLLRKYKSPMRCDPEVSCSKLQGTFG